MNPFKLTGPTCLSFSGGRTSAYMLWMVLQYNTAEDISRWLVVCFANTGKEDEATLRFVDRCRREWGIAIVWIEYREGAEQFSVVNFETASRNGEPFEALMRTRRLLPNPMSRFCTTELKIRPMARYLRSKGFEGTMDDLENFSWIGIRADEPRRIAKVSRERVPLAAASITAQDVGAFWAAHSFDLALPNMAGKTMHGNCDLCFLKPAAQVQALIAEKPERAVWWARMERDIPALGRTTPTGSVFRLDRPTYQRMAEIASDQSDMFNHDEEAIACFCGD